MAAKTTTIGPDKEGQSPIKFRTGALHEQLHVPAGEKIPAEKREAALAGKYGSLAAKRARFGFKGALAAGRRTAARR
jgi:hypothetical protein